MRVLWVLNGPGICEPRGLTLWKKVRALQLMPGDVANSDWLRSVRFAGLMCQHEIRAAAADRAFPERRWTELGGVRDLMMAAMLLMMCF